MINEKGLPALARLEFRCWTAADGPLARALWGDPEVTRHFGGAMSPEAADARLALEMARQRRVGVQYWPVFLRETGEFAGCAGLRPFHKEAGVFEVGVHLARAMWSRRLGEEAVRAVIAYGFGVLGAVRLMAGHGPEHENSKAMLGRVGFVFSHFEPWGTLGLPHPFYRLEREAECAKVCKMKGIP